MNAAVASIAPPDDMADLLVPPYSRREIIEAGKVLRGKIRDDTQSIEQAHQVFRIANDWRIGHLVPMRHMRRGLDAILRRDKIPGLTAARLKRMKSIREKLAKGTSLLEMQDICGCRVIVSTPAEVERLAAIFSDGLVHQYRGGAKDYIGEPKSDGYRGIHQVYRYQGRGEFSALNDKLILVEVQIRTDLQHAWATAVETVASVTGEDLKHYRGDEAWRRFFALVSSEMAAVEGRPLVVATPEDPRRRLKEIRELDQSLNALATLEQLTEAVRAVTNVRRRISDTFIVTLDPHARTVEVTTTLPGGSAAEYRSAEQQRRKNSVLVEVDRAKDLQAAYPNYYLDTKYFTQFVSGRLKANFVDWSSTGGLKAMLERAQFFARKGKGSR